MMSNLTYFGFLGCAAVYAAIGLIGVLLLGTQPGIVGAGDGYGTVRIATPQ